MIVTRSYDREHTGPKRTRKRVSNPTRTISGLVDARAMAKKHPRTFEVPSESQLKRLTAGDYVKLGRNGERFWVRVDGFVGRRWHGTISNDLVRNIDIKDGDSIYFMRKHIHDVLKK